MKRRPSAVEFTSERGGGMLHETFCGLSGGGVYAPGTGIGGPGGGMLWSCAHLRHIRRPCAPAENPGRGVAGAVFQRRAGSMPDRSCPLGLDACTPWHGGRVCQIPVSGGGRRCGGTLAEEGHGAVHGDQLGQSSRRPGKRGEGTPAPEEWGYDDRAGRDRRTLVLGAVREHLRLCDGQLYHPVRRAGEGCGWRTGADAFAARHGGRGARVARGQPAVCLSA